MSQSEEKVVKGRQARASKEHAHNPVIICLFSKHTACKVSAGKGFFLAKQAALFNISHYFSACRYFEEDYVDIDDLLMRINYSTSNFLSLSLSLPLLPSFYPTL